METKAYNSSMKLVYGNMVTVEVTHRIKTYYCRSSYSVMPEKAKNR